MTRYKKVFLSSLACVLLLSTLNIIASAISSSDISSASPKYGYYFPSESISYSVAISGAANNPATVKVLYPYYTYNSQSRTSLKTLTRSGTSYTYTGSSSPASSVWVPGRKPGSHSTWQTRGFCIEASKGGTTVTDDASGYITAMLRSKYSSNDSTFSYTNTTSNSFYGVATPKQGTDSLTYNCLAYAVSVNTSWLWPWSGNPTESQLDAYMSKSSPYSSREGNKLTYSTSRNGCDVIYYSDNNWGVGNDGHFARVIAWSSTGNPTRISSKWGFAELIESSSYDPFNGGSGNYGSAKRYYKFS
jgi:hypothetical protein